MTQEEKEHLGLALFAGAFVLTTTVLSRKEPMHRAVGTAFFTALDKYRQAKREREQSEVITVDIEHEEVPNLQLGEINQTDVLV